MKRTGMTSGVTIFEAIASDERKLKNLLEVFDAFGFKIDTGVQVKDKNRDWVLKED